MMIHFFGKIGMVVLCMAMAVPVLAFEPACSSCRSKTSLQASRRQILVSVVGTTVAAVTTAAKPAAATYSAYSRREQDWQERADKGEVQFSTAGKLRQQLREIAPMNTESSRIFCPNGPTAAVSPLMENRCGDRLATPSVYGRSNDVLGNSVPGFGNEWTLTNDSSASLSAEVGGFPKYR